MDIERQKIINLSAHAAMLAASTVLQRFKLEPEDMLSVIEKMGDLHGKCISGLNARKS